MALLALTLGTQAAHAEPCEVRFIQAPDDARIVIERWLANEPRCAGQIDLRVIATAQGTLYLVAQRPDGRVHERDVPNADAAGVLVASWVADPWTDEAEPPAEPVPPPMSAPAPVVAAAPAGLVARTDAEREPRSLRRAALSTMIASYGRGGLGLRGEVDVLALGRFRVGAVVSATHAEVDQGVLMPEYMSITQLSLLAQVAAEFHAGWGVTVRPAIAYGAQVATTRRYNQEGHGLGSDGSGWGEMLQTSLVVSKAIGERWTMLGGAALSLNDREGLRRVNGYVNKLETDVFVLIGAGYAL